MGSEPLQFVMNGADEEYAVVEIQGDDGDGQRIGQRQDFVLGSTYEEFNRYGTATAVQHSPWHAFFVTLTISVLPLRKPRRLCPTVVGSSWQYCSVFARHIILSLVRTWGTTYLVRPGREVEVARPGIYVKAYAGGRADFREGVSFRARRPWLRRSVRILAYDFHARILGQEALRKSALEGNTTTKPSIAKEKRTFGRTTTGHLVCSTKNTTPSIVQFVLRLTLPIDVAVPCTAHLYCVYLLRLLKQQPLFS